MASLGVVVVGHGSRVPDGNQRVVEVVAELQARLPQATVSHGFLELADPSLSEALREAASAHEHVIVLPLLLFASGHAKVDIPAACAQAQIEFPAARFVQTDVIGSDPRMLDILDDRVGDLDCMENQSVLLLAGRGSSDDAAQAAFRSVCDTFAARHDFMQVVPCYAGISEPRVPDAVVLAVQLNPVKILLLPFLLFPGVLTERLSTDLREGVDEVLGLDAKSCDTLYEGRIIEVLLDRCATAQARFQR